MGERPRRARVRSRLATVALASGLLVLGLPVPSARAVDYQASPYFQAVTVNVCGNMCDVWDRYKISQIGNLIKNRGADVVSINEICDGQLNSLLDYLRYDVSWPMYGYHGRNATVSTRNCTANNGAGHYGNAVLTRNAPTSAVDLDLTTPAGKEQRSNTCVTSTIWSRAAQACATHLSTEGDGGATARAPQIRQIRDHDASVGSTMIIVQMGDFNTAGGTASTELTAMYDLLDEVDDTRNTYNVANSYTYKDTPGQATRKLDYLFYGAARAGSEKNYNVLPVKLDGPSNDGSGGEFDHQAVPGLRMFVR